MVGNAVCPRRQVCVVETIFVSLLLPVNVRKKYSKVNLQVLRAGFSHWSVWWTINWCETNSFVQHCRVSRIG